MNMNYASYPRNSNYSSTKFHNTGNFTQLWSKTPHKSKEEYPPTKNIHPKTPLKKKIQGQDFNDKIIMSKKQLIEFTKRFALNKVDYEQEIQFLKADCEDKSKQIEVLENQIKDFITQEDYFIAVIEQLRDRHLNQMTAIKNKYECQMKMRQDQIDHLKQEIAKVRVWLEEEKVQTKKCMDFIKMKDVMIQKLQQQISHNKNQYKNTRQSKLTSVDLNNFHSIATKPEQTPTQRPRINSNKKIIIKRERKSQRNKSQEKEQCEQRHSLYQDKDNYRKQSQQIIKLTNIINNLRGEKIQVEDEKFEIYNKFREISIQNDYLRRAIVKIQKQRQEQLKMKKSIHDLDEVTKRIKDSQVGKESLLASKCLFLEKHVQKLTKQLSEAKSSVIISLSNLSSQQYSSQSNLQYQQ